MFCSVKAKKAESQTDYSNNEELNYHPEGNKALKVDESTFLKAIKA